MRKVLFISSLYKPHVGGCETFIHELCTYYRTKGIEPVVLTKRYPQDLEAFEDTGNEKIVRIKRPMHVPEDFHAAMDEILAREDLLKADLVHVVGVRRPLPFFGLLLARRWGVPCVASFLGNDVPSGVDAEQAAIWKEGIDIIPDSVKQMDGYHTFSNATAQCAQNLMPFVENIRVIRGSIDLDVIQQATAPKPDFPYIFTARRLVPTKGIDVLIRSFASLSPIYPQLKLLIAGEGEEKAKLEALTNNLGIKDRVDFLGNVPFNSMCSLMKGAVTHVCPSRTEGGGLVNITASACGCLPIGTKVEGIPEYISENITGLLCEPDNIEQLTAHLATAMEAPPHVAQMKKEGLKFAEKFSLPAVAENLLELYEKAGSLNLMDKPFRSWSPLTKEMEKYTL